MNTHSPSESVVHESNGVEFYVDGGEVRARTKDGDRWPQGMITNLLLLDIAQTLAGIRQWGIAQDREGGQCTQVMS